MTLEECFERRQLRKIAPDAAKARKSLETAGLKLAEAEELLKAGFAPVAVVTAYSSMFHAARALLFKDGIQEKSHYCLSVYIRENYVKTGKLSAGLVTIMDSFREERHDIMYGLEGIKVEQGEGGAAVENARKLIDAVKSLI